MKLLDKLTELRYEQVDENCWRGKGADGKSEIYVAVLEDGKVEVVKKFEDEDIPATLITFSRDCDQLEEMLERWSVRDRQATTD